MWRFALLAPLLAAATPADPQAEKNNFTSVAVSYSATSQQSSLNTPSSSWRISSTLSATKDASQSSSSTPSPGLSSSLLSSSSSLSGASKLSSNTQLSASASIPKPGSLHTLTPSSQRPSTVSSISVHSNPSVSSLPKSTHGGNSTRLSSVTRSSNATTTGLCTGCAIQAQNPITTFFDNDDFFNQWTSVVVTATVVTSFVTYNDTVLTTSRTVNQTKTLVLTDDDETITHHTPTFRITPTDGVVLTVDAGPTYVIWQDIYGGLDRLVTGAAASTCGATPTKLKNWQPKRDADWNYFIQTYSRNSTAPKNTKTAISVPSEALQYLKNNLAIQSQFHGSDIATCTFHTTALSKTANPNQPAFTLMPFPPAAPSRLPPQSAPAQSPPPLFSVTTGTFLSTTYATTVTHVTRAGCLRCQDTAPAPDPTPDDPRFSNKLIDDPQPTPIEPNVSQPSVRPDDPSKPNGNGNNPSKPENSPKPDGQQPPGVPVVIGGSTYTVNPVKQTPQPDRPNAHDQAPPAVVIDSQTYTPGQTATINGVPVIVPIPTPGESGVRIVVNGNTIPIPNNSPTNAPVLTVGANTITANPQGQFIVGTQTLKPGGPAVTIEGNTLSLASSGAIAIVNGVTHTLEKAPLITPAPVITLGGRIVSVTVSNGNTQLFIGAQTLVPGSAITVDGVTYSIPASESGKIIVNGVTSTLYAGQGIPIGQQYVTASVKDGTTSYVLAPGHTLTPGGVVTVSGTTFSMPASASGSIVVVNGVTSTLGPSSPTTPLALTINGQTYTASVRSGTTEFVLGQGVTLRPGQSVVMSGTTYSLDGQGTALVINGQTSTISRGPASNSASTTADSSARSTTSARDAGNFIWSGIGGGGGSGGSSSTGGGTPTHRGYFDNWAESLVIGVAGWLLLL